MKQYRGYYLDGTWTKEDIDSFIKARTIKSLQRAVANTYSTTDAEMAMAWSGRADELAQFLIRECGMTPAEVEAVEVA